MAKRDGEFAPGFIVALAFYNNKDMVAVRFPDEWEIWYPASDSTKKNGSIKVVEELQK